MLPRNTLILETMKISRINKGKGCMLIKGLLDQMKIHGILL